MARRCTNPSIYECVAEGLQEADVSRLFESLAWLVGHHSVAGCLSKWVIKLVCCRLVCVEAKDSVLCGVYA